MDDFGRNDLVPAAQLAEEALSALGEAMQEMDSESDRLIVDVQADVRDAAQTALDALADMESAAKSLAQKVQQVMTMSKYGG